MQEAVRRLLLPAPIEEARRESVGRCPTLRARFPLALWPSRSRCAKPATKPRQPGCHWPSQKPATARHLWLTRRRPRQAPSFAGCAARLAAPPARTTRQRCAQPVRAAEGDAAPAAPAMPRPKVSYASWTTRVRRFSVAAGCQEAVRPTGCAFGPVPLGRAPPVLVGRAGRPRWLGGGSGGRAHGRRGLGGPRVDAPAPSSGSPSPGTRPAFAAPLPRGHRG